MKDVKQIVALLQDRDKAISQLQKQKKVLHKNLDEDSAKRKKLIASMSVDEFSSVLAKEHVYKEREDEKTRASLMEFYGVEYRDMIFEKAVRCTDKELTLRNPYRDHKEVVEKVLVVELEDQKVQRKEDSISRFHTPHRYSRR